MYASWQEKMMRSELPLLSANSSARLMIVVLEKFESAVGASSDGGLCRLSSVIQHKHTDKVSHTASH